MPVQKTIDIADALVTLVNAAAIGVTFSRAFVPEFDADDLAAPKGVVVPRSITIEPGSRTTDFDDHSIEIGIGRRISSEDADMKAGLLVFEALVDVIRAGANKSLTTSDGDTVCRRGTVEVRLYDPEHVRKRVSLSVLRVTYRG